MRAFTFTLCFMQSNDYKQKLYKAKFTMLYKEILGPTISTNLALIKTNQFNHAKLTKLKSNNRVFFQNIIWHRSD